MSIIQVKGTGGITAAERTLFVGPRVPNEIRAMVKQLRSIDQATFRNLLQLLVKDFEGKEIESSVMDDIVTDTMNEEQIAVIYSGLYKLLQLAIRVPSSTLKQQGFKEDLKELKVPDQFIADIASAVYGTRRTHIDAHALQEQPRLPKLDSFRWRVDVAISTSVLNRVIEPSILMDMQLSDGSQQQFEVNKAQFDELRYNVAVLLKEMEEVEKRNILKIEDKS